MSTLRDQIKEIIYSDYDLGDKHEKALVALFKQQMLGLLGEDEKWDVQIRCEVCGEFSPNQEYTIVRNKLRAQLRQEVEKL